VNSKTFIVYKECSILESSRSGQGPVNFVKWRYIGRFLLSVQVNKNTTKREQTNKCAIVDRLT